MPALPPVPEDQAIFYYASQNLFWIYFRVKRTHFEAECGDHLKSLGFTATPFVGDEDSVFVALNPMFYTAQFNNGLAGISETEFNVLVHPTSQAARLPSITFEQFLLGWEQQKVVGQLRLDVLCDDLAAVEGGRGKYGEHKFPGQIAWEVPVPNDNAQAPRPYRVLFVARQMPREGQSEGDHCFTFTASTGDALPFASNGSEVVVYSALPPEPAPGVTQQAIGTRRNLLGMFDAWMVADGNGEFEIQYGDCKDAPPLVIDGEVVPGSTEFPRQMRERMQTLLTGSDVVAFQLFRSPPCEIEPRPYYVDPC